MGFCSGGEKLDSILNTAWAKGGCIVKEQDKGQVMENYQEETSGVRRILVK